MYSRNRMCRNYKALRTMPDGYFCFSGCNLQPISHNDLSLYVSRHTYPVNVISLYQTYRQTDKQTERKDRQKEQTETVGRIETRQTVRQANRQRDRRTQREKHTKNTDRQTAKNR